MVPGDTGCATVEPHAVKVDPHRVSDESGTHIIPVHSDVLDSYEVLPLWAREHTPSMVPLTNIPP